MKKLRVLRTRAGVSAAAVVLSGAGLGLTTATPAAAYAGYCNGQVGRTISNSGYHAKIPAYNGNVDCYMNRGAQSKAVSALQTTLNKCYGRNLDVDGIFGNNTRNALIYAQGREDISADGGYGKQTRTNIKWAYQYSGGIGQWACFYITNW
ncbi:peptidoglycan-binding protein [Streptomyces sp. AC512_CC834]|uniref:peptidoglycan-binding domain-containing protein n=1 Tax=Streptomyces sp. AC512_CC834 TaxID=2823691 RepID=UPI001C25E78A|nr:peptidoglycan-binding domain-containing protein [Streptomyces sp. AC512_CC834]